MKGVTIAVFRAFKGRDVSKAELRAISADDLRTIYRRDYWDKVRGDDLPAGLDLVAFDGAVNSGPAQSAKWLQRAIGVKDDGRIGAGTIEAALASDVRAVIGDALDKRLGMLRRLKTWPTFGRGWQSRVDDIRARALAAAAQPMTIIATLRPVVDQPLASNPVGVNEAPQSDRQSMWAAILALLRRIFGGRK